MYEAFYHLSTNPFRLTPDPKFCFSYTGYKYAREYLDYALRLGEGFIMVTGQPGTGKTTLAETFLKDLDPTEVAARRIVASSLEADDLLRSVAYAYGIEAESLDKATLRRRIQQYFTRQVQSGWRTLLIIDEAQGIPLPALEELRLLADMQVGSQPLLQLFFVGQEKLCDLMRMPEMEQFQQRVLATCHLIPLDLQETRAYIEYRLCQADWKGDPEFSGAAVRTVYQRSRGVPRHINKLCNRLLLLGYGKGKHILDIEDVQAISAELENELLTPLDNGQGNTAEGNASLPETGPEDGSLSLPGLALRMEPEQAEAPILPVPVTPVPRPEAATAARHSEQAAAWRVQDAVKARRGQPAQPSTPRRAGVSGPFGVRPRSSPLQPVAGRAGRKAKMATMASALLVATLAMTGLARFPGGDRSDDGVPTGTPPVPAMPGLLGLDGHREIPGSLFSEPAGQRSVSQTPASVPPVTPVVEPPVENSRVSGGTTRIGIAARTAQHIPDNHTANENPAMRPADALPERAGLSQIAPESDVARDTGEDEFDQRIVASLPPAESGTLPDQPLDAVPDEPELTGAAADPDGIPRVETSLAMQEPERPEPSGAADDAGQRDPGGEPAAVTPVSRAEKIAALLARGQQSLKDFRLLTPAGNSAHYYYQEVLAMDPGNAAARDGLDRIVAAYGVLVRRARERGEDELAKLYSARGLSVQPGNPGLLALQDSLEKQQANPGENMYQAAHAVDSEPQTQPQTQPQPQPQPQPEPERQQESVLAWLISLFGVAGPEQPEVVDRSIPVAD